MLFNVVLLPKYDTFTLISLFNGKFNTTIEHKYSV